MADLPRKRPESRRLLAADLFAKGKSYVEVSRTLVVSLEAARRWKLRWDAGGKEALKERRVGKRGPTYALADKDAHAIVNEAKKKGGKPNLNEYLRIAEKRGLEVTRSSLRRKLIALGYWPAGKGD